MPFFEVRDIKRYHISLKITDHYGGNSDHKGRLDCIFFVFSSKTILLVLFSSLIEMLLLSTDNLIFHPVISNFGLWIPL